MIESVSTLHLQLLDILHLEMCDVAGQFGGGVAELLQHHLLYVLQAQLLQLLLARECVGLDGDTGHVGQAEGGDGGGEGGGGQLKYLPVLPIAGHITVLTLTEGQGANVTEDITWCEADKEGQE